jgi:anti-sigma regulatory factor (Ser/Thr protein kinase)
MAFSPTTGSAGWPLQSYLEFGALPTAVACGRLHAKQVLWEWDMDALADAAEIIVSELMTNAVQASVGLTRSLYGGQWSEGLPPVRLWLFSDQRRVAVQVWDGNDNMPVPEHLPPDAEGGRGLLLVETLSAEWGFYSPQASSGKIVWALIEPFSPGRAGPVGPAGPVGRPGGPAGPRWGPVSL